MLARNRLNDDTPAEGHLRICIVQPVVPGYREPLFRALAEKPDMCVTVRAGLSSPGDPDTSPSALRSTFRFELSRTSRLGPMLVQTAQWTSIDRETFDAVILSWNVRYLWLFPALLKGRVVGMPIVLWGHAKSPRDNPLKRWVRRQAARLAAYSVVYSESALERFSGYRSIRSRVTVAPNAIDQTPLREAEQWWRREPEMFADFLDRHGLRSSRVLLFVARLSAERRLDLLLNALLDVIPCAPNVRLIIIGDGGERANLETMTKALSLSSRVSFLGAIYEERSLAPWFMASDAFVFPSGIGLSLLSAFGYGLPVITSDAKDAHGPEFEFIEHGVNGLLYEAKSSSSLAQCIREMLSSPALRARLARGARHTVSSAGPAELNATIGGLTQAITLASAHFRRTP